MRLNQDSAGAAEELEDMLRQLEDGKRDQLYETEKCVVLRDALRSISDKMFEMSENQLLKVEISVDFPNFEEVHPVTAGGYGGPDNGGGGNGGDSHLVPDLYRKKQELRRKVLMEKEMKKFYQACHTRSEILVLEVRKLCEALERTREDLDEAENKIDSDQLQLRMLEAELAKLRLTVEMGKNNLQRSEKTLVPDCWALMKLECVCYLTDWMWSRVMLENYHGGPARLTAKVRGPDEGARLAASRTQQAAGGPEAPHDDAL